MHEIQLELDRMVAAGLPGAFAYIEAAGGASRFYAAGLADLDARTPMSPASVYRAGSTTKSLTAVVVLQLVGGGGLSLDDTVRDLLPELPVPNAAVLTVEHLLRMRSGLFDFVDDSSLLPLDANLRPWTLRQVVDLAIRHPPGFEPGSRYGYCNTNFCILELIVERITGNTLRAEFERRIFEPLGMKRSSYPDADDLGLPEPYIRGYDRAGRGWRECSRVFFGRGDGGLLSTAVDLARFFRGLLVDRRLLPDALLARMMSVVPDDPPAEKAYGLGLIADPLAFGAVWGHSGRGFGYRHAPFLRLENGRFAVFMTNGTHGFKVPSPVAGEAHEFSDDARAAAYL